MKLLWHVCFYQFIGFWCPDNLEAQEDLGDSLLISEPEEYRGHYYSSSGDWFVRLQPFGSGIGSLDPMCSVSSSVSAGFLSPHFCFHVLFVVSLLVVVVCEVIYIMGKASSKPKAPLKLFLSHFWDFKEATAVSAGSAAL